ncbi:Pre-rRNA-processing protein tsr2 [Vanrija pseudolonga]|uniref:Pre-rRNA-processing protein tsr2 n=1 Tax=Vanrija pseudolonga TaxID=143232 RepID=A0AAF1BH05_9TREE|nr:Pre-rRNA-processing protein tsr2 [Vanrija pseudolonga]
MSDPAPSPQILHFARGVVALLDLWPALTIAVREGWGGHESADKKTWLASELIDAFESRADYTEADGVRTVDASNAADPPLDIDQLADLLTQVMSDEFDAAIEDGSVEPLSADILRLWRDVVAPSARTPEETVAALERKAAEVTRTGVSATSGGGPQEEDGSDWESEDDDDEMDEDEAPQLVPAEQPRQRQEPVVDEDGFTVVQKGRRR